MWFGLQTVNILNHVPHSRPSSTACTKTRAHTQPITYNTIPQKDNMIPYMAQSRYPLNSQVLAIFFPFATPHYLLLTDKHSPQYGMFMFLLHFMTNTFFWTFVTLSPPRSTSMLLLNHTASPIPCLPPSLTLLTKNNFSDSTFVFPSYSPDLGCVEAQRKMFLGRFLVQFTHLLSGGPRLARMWLNLDLARNRCLDSENQGTIDNSL